MMTSAHASWISDAATSFVESVSSVANLLLPIEAVKDIYNQMNLMVSGSPDFDPLSLALSSVEVVSYFPVASPIRPLIKTVRQVYGLISRNARAIRALGGFMDKVIVQTKRGNFTLIEKSLPFMLVAAEILREDPEIIDVMIDSIQSLDDLNTWMEFFALPGDAWEGEGIPDVELAGNSEHLPMSWLFPQAYAAKLKLPRGLGKEIKEVIREAITSAKAEIQANPKALSGGLRSMIELLKNSTTKAIRSKAVRGVILGLTIKHFRNVSGNFKKLVSGKSNVRVHPVILLLSIAYLEDKYGLDDDNIYPEILKKYVPIVRSLAASKPLPGKTLELSPEAHGAVFHLAMLAKYTLEGADIKGVEVRKNINIFKQDDFDEFEIRTLDNYKPTPPIRTDY